MKVEETMEILNRINIHYPEFNISDEKIEEWQSKLNKYDFEDVNTRLEQHLSDSQQGNFPPKLFILTNNLMTKEEKQTIGKGKVECQICRRWLPLKDYEKHFQRCSSIRWIVKKYDDYFPNKEVDKAWLYNANSIDFERIYKQVAKYVYENTKDYDEKQYLKEFLREV